MSERTYRSLREIERPDEVAEERAREFLEEVPIDGEVDRRDFLTLMGASLAMAGALGGCTRQPVEEILPYVRQPEHLVPGRPLQYATTLQQGGLGIGVLVESHEGRPHKVDGNPLHPSCAKPRTEPPSDADVGPSDVRLQAEVLDLYDPDRSRAVLQRGEVSTWGAFTSALALAMDLERSRRGRSFRLLTGTVGSPTLAAQIRALLEAMPEARWHQWEAVFRDNAAEGARIAFGEPLAVHPHLARADVIVSFDSDFLARGPGHLVAARDFADRRVDPRGMNRLYVVETTVSVTGMNADHRVALRPSEIEPFARAVARALGVRAEGPVSSDPRAEAIARDLEAHRGASLALAGDEQPPAVHALAHAINGRLDNLGRTVTLTAPAEARTESHLSSLAELVGDLRAGRVETLVMIGVNPVYDAPGDLGFASALEKARLRVHVGDRRDETAFGCHWHVPMQHAFEGWSDAVGHDGTASIVQPLIAPLWGARSVHEVMGVLSGQPDVVPLDLVKSTWQARLGLAAGPDLDRAWRRALHDGVWADTAHEAREVSVRPDLEIAPTAEPAAGEDERRSGLGTIDVVFRPDPHLWDGRNANNGWLLEIPRPVTKIVWENAALIAPATAARLELEDGDVIEIAHDGRKVRAPVLRAPGHAKDAVTLHLGYGRTRAGHVGDGKGFDANRLRTTKAPWAIRDAQLRRTGDHIELVTTQGHWDMQGRAIARTATAAQLVERPDAIPAQTPAPPRHLTLYPLPAEYEQARYGWGMSIDLSRCIACNACIAACTSENNIAIIGKDEVRRGREMFWLRVDTYFEGDVDAPNYVHQPVPCMHCENAPCEYVCPVAATSHTPEGLNDMTYNRCVGTRYCGNNCPYKVRRFNFFGWSDRETPSVQLRWNPDVTVRARGVMEKCTYCVQRINQARITSERERREIRDGEIATACEQACPAKAITFGNIKDDDSRVAREKADPRSYQLLAELGTRPRTTYMGAIRNPNPDFPANREERG